jgi:hypothetical protein
MENGFVLHRLPSPITRALRTKAQMAGRWALFMRGNISGFASNIAPSFCWADSCIHRVLA